MKETRTGLLDDHDRRVTIQRQGYTFGGEVERIFTRPRLCAQA
jgi:DNA-binding winged helix-turn-helix (wHTH) protein